MRRILNRTNRVSLFLWISILATVYSQIPDASGSTKIHQDSRSAIAGDAKHFLNVGWGIAGAPLHFNTADGRRACLIVSSTALLFTTDKNVQNFALSHHSPFHDNLFNLDGYYGNRYTFSSSVGLYGLGYLFKSNRIRLMGLHSVEAICYARTITGLLKALLGRRRPYGGESNLVFKPFKLQALYGSLPSGHATVSFAASTVMAKSLNHPLWKIFWYGAGAMVAASRVYHNSHWVSDVFWGGIIGYSTASYVMNFDKRGEISQNHHPLE